MHIVATAASSLELLGHKIEGCLASPLKNFERIWPALMMDESVTANVSAEEIVRDDPASVQFQIFSKI